MLKSSPIFLRVKEHTGMGRGYGSKRNMGKENLVGNRRCRGQEAVMGYNEGLLERISGLKMRNKETCKRL